MFCCKYCGESYEGDGYKTILHCPNVSEDRYELHNVAPDGEPIDCEELTIELNCND